MLESSLEEGSHIHVHSSCQIFLYSPISSLNIITVAEAYNLSCKDQFLPYRAAQTNVQDYLHATMA